MNKALPLKKTSLTCNRLTGLATLILLLMVVHYPSHASGLSRTQQSPAAYATSDTILSILVNKSQSSKKNKIRLYPDAKREVLFFSATGEDGKVYQLYLFDMDGRLVNQASIRNHETTVLTNISGGNYLYEVFVNDERVQNGQLIVK